MLRRYTEEEQAKKKKEVGGAEEEVQADPSLKANRVSKFDPAKRRTVLSI